MYKVGNGHRLRFIDSDFKGQEEATNKEAAAEAIIKANPEEETRYLPIPLQWSLIVTWRIHVGHFTIWSDTGREELMRVMGTVLRQG